MTQHAAVYEIARLRALRAGFPELDARAIGVYARLHFEIESPTSGHRALCEGNRLIDTIKQRSNDRQIRTAS